MLQQVLAELRQLKVQTQLIMNRQEQFQQKLDRSADTPQTQVQKALDQLREFIQRCKIDPHSFLCVTDWMELEDLVDNLRQIQSQLPSTLFRQVWSRLRDSRQRLQRNPHDEYAVNQLDYIEKVLTNAVQGFDHT
jgi:type VI protein secretion system component VasF